MTASGRFTYFQFAANREMPWIYTLSPDNEEARANFKMEGNLAAVQRMGRRFILRLGEAAVGVWNEAFDADGAPTPWGVTVPRFTRTIR
jgi:type IV secretion system protein VirB9